MLCPLYFLLSFSFFFLPLSIPFISFLHYFSTHLYYYFLYYKFIYYTIKKLTPYNLYNKFYSTLVTPLGPNGIYQFSITPRMFQNTHMKNFIISQKFIISSEKSFNIQFTMNINILLLHLNFSTIYCLLCTTPPLLRHFRKYMKIKDDGFSLDNHFIDSLSISRALVSKVNSYRCSYEPTCI